MLYQLITENLNKYITSASIVLFIITASLTAILILIKFTYMIWQEYAKKIQARLKPVFEEYIQNPQNTDLGNFKFPTFPNNIILHKFIIFRSFGETGKTFENIAAAYEKLGFAHLDLRRLESLFWWKRAEAARCLGQIRLKEAKSFLVKKLKDPVVEVRLITAWALGRIGDTDTILPSMEALVSSSKLAGMRLSSTVFEIGEKAIPVLIQTLKHNDPAVQLLALHLLGEMKANRAVQPIIEKTSGNEYKEVRIAAYKALGTISDKCATDCLVEGLNDSLWEVRAQAARGLGYMPSDKVIEPLTKALEDQKWWVRRNAGEALFRLGTAGKAALTSVTEKSHSEYARNMAGQWLNEYI